MRDRHLYVESRFQLLCMFAIMFLTMVLGLLFIWPPRTDLEFLVVAAGFFILGHQLSTRAYLFGEWLRKRKEGK